MGQKQSQQSASHGANGKVNDLPTYSYSDVSKHNTEDSTWVVIDNFVFDMTKFVPRHPGGSYAIYHVAGTDASKAFEVAMHPDYAIEELQDYLVGKIRIDEEDDTKPQQPSTTTVQNGNHDSNTSNNNNEYNTAATQNASPSSRGGDTSRYIGIASNNITKMNSNVHTNNHVSSSQSTPPTRHLFILYGTQTGTAKRYGELMKQKIEHTVSSTTTTTLSTSIHNVKDIDVESLSSYDLLLLIISTSTDGMPPTESRLWCNELTELCVDFRVQQATHLNALSYAVVGLGNSMYEYNYNTVAHVVYEQLQTLGATSMCPLGELDEQSSDVGMSQQHQMAKWCDEMFIPALMKTLNTALTDNDTQTNVARATTNVKPTDADGNSTSSKTPATVNSSNKAKKSKHNASRPTPAKRSNKSVPSHANDEPEGDQDNDEEVSASEGDDDDIPYNNDDGSDAKNSVVDLEDLGVTMRHAKQAANHENGSTATSSKTGKMNGNATEKSVPKAMLTPNLRAALSKQGYKLIGTHSGVKLCRWTKAMMRGRGGCYKHTFYGIESSSCMEVTPSLACANKCVFCWRHHTNPVGRSWRWEIDKPEYIVENAAQQHLQMIKQQRGVPGVTTDTLERANTIRHCALSLVGEPIMYPHINEFIELLHRRHISSFLVTNAQFPDAIKNLQPVTQLYVSIDASTKDALKAIDRPLFTDFWDRYLESLRYIGQKQQRTVYRFTLVKSYNMSEVAEYSKLIALGQPTFIEIKGVTFTNQHRSNMTMKDVPWHYEVKSFADTLCGYAGDRYEVACEHQHSCSVLIADKRLKINGKWHTWIDYERYHQLVMRYYESGELFDTLDYCRETPSWALIDSVEAGFNPQMTRVHIKGKQAKAMRDAALEQEKRKAMEVEEMKHGEEEKVNTERVIDNVQIIDLTAQQSTSPSLPVNSSACGGSCACANSSDNGSSLHLSSNTGGGTQCCSAPSFNE